MGGENENHTSFALATAGNTTVVLDPASVEDLAGLDVSGLAEALLTSVLGKTLIIAQAGHGAGKGGSESDGDGGTHFEFVRRV